MKTAVVYYSLDGNCAFVAKQIKTMLNADLVRLQTQDEKQRGFIGKLFWGGGMVVLGKKPPLKPYAFDPSVYDLIVIGAPVWAGSPAPPIHTFTDGAGITGKKIALFVCHGGGMRNALEKFRSWLTGNEISAEADFVSPIKNGEETKRRITDWAKGLEGKE